MSSLSSSAIIDITSDTSDITPEIISTTSTSTSASAPAPPKKNKKTKPATTADTDDPDNECPVCCSTFNKSTNKPVICPYSECSYPACNSCIRTYLINNPLSQPHCMACKKHFNDLFIVEKLTKTWTYDTYKPHITKVMVDIELSKLGESMQEAENRKVITKLNYDKKELTQKYLNEMKALRENYEKALENIDKDIDSLAPKKKQHQQERKIFSMPCSYNDCKGMLSSQYKCGICDKYTCKDCHEPLQDEHKCNPDNVATTQAIKKETRPCPSCSTRIFKISGCDQMWCTSCKTPFSWVTGKAVPLGQTIHNPHAIEFFKQNGVNVRAPGDVVCGGLIDYRQFDHIDKLIKTRIEPLFRSLVNHDTCCINHVLAHTIQLSSPSTISCKNNIFRYIANLLYNAYCIVGEVSRNQLREAREVTQANYNYNEQRVQYILNLCSRDDLTEIIHRDNKHKKIKQELSFIWEILSTFGIEMFVLLYNLSIKPIHNIETSLPFIRLLIQKLNEFSSLIKYVNSQVAIISVAHNCSVYTINFDIDFANIPDHLIYDNFNRVVRFSNAMRLRLFPPSS